MASGVTRSRSCRALWCSKMSEAKYPHCSAQVLHAPGECYFCDKYPKAQAERRASGTPFTLNESNGWSGNVAVPAGRSFTHMGLTSIADDNQRHVSEVDWVIGCDRPPRGWYCSKEYQHPGACPTRARWWNLKGKLWEIR